MSHVYFNDDGEVITTPKTPASTKGQPNVAITPTESSVDSSSEYEEDDTGSCPFADDDDFSSDTSSDSARVVSVQSHAPSSHRYRQAVDMSQFASLETHLTVLVQMEPRSIKTLLGRVAELVGWAMHVQCMAQNDAVHDLIVTKPWSILKYITVLKGEFHLKNGTVYNTLLDFLRWAKYLATYETKPIAQFVAIVEAQQRTEAKNKKADIRARLCRENLMQQRQWPVGGKQELSNILQKHKSRVDSIINKGMAGKVINNNDITFASDWVIGHLFVENPQGRSHAISTFPHSRLSELACGNTTSTEFKTRATYGSQSINCGPLTYKYLNAYVKYIRPYWSGNVTNPEEVSDALFITKDGRAYSDIGVCVTRFFRGVSKYHITTTRLRSLFETEVHEAVQAGVLTPNECDDVIRNSGHSSTTAHTHYLKRKAETVGRRTMDIHSKMYNTDRRATMPPPGDNQQNDEDAWYDPTLAKSDSYDDDDVDDTFALNSGGDRRRQRVDWTEAELENLTAWVHDYEAQFGTRLAKNWRACSAVMEQAQVCPDCHLTTSSLREAWRREQKKQSTKLTI